VCFIQASSSAGSLFQEAARRPSSAKTWDVEAREYVVNKEPRMGNESLERPPERGADTRRRDNEVVWLPAVMGLLVFQALTLVHGLQAPLPEDVQVVYVASLGLVGLSVLLLLVAALRHSHVWRSLAVSALAIGVAADVFVATSAATGAVLEAALTALLIVAVWATVWSITGSHSAL
jgi:hypothetical protein